MSLKQSPAVLVVLLLAAPAAVHADPLEGAPEAPLDEAVAAAEKHWLDRNPETVDAYALVLEAALRAGEGPERLDTDAEALLGLRRLTAAGNRVGISARARKALESWAGADAAGHARETVFRARLQLAFLQPPGSPSQHLDGTGFLQSWRIVGPFENERGGSFTVTLEPEEDVLKPPAGFVQKSYAGKNRPVAWRELPRQPLAGRVDLAALLTPNEEALAYGLTYVKSATAKEVALRFGSNDGYRVWVNGERVASGDVHRPFRYDQNAVTVRLREGWNSLLFKVAQAKDAWEFAARLTELDGASLSDVQEGWPGDGEPVAAVTAAGASDESSDESPPAPAKESPLPTLVSALQERLDAEASGDGGEPSRRARQHYVLGALLRLQHAHDLGEHPDAGHLEQAIALDDGVPIYHVELARSRERASQIAAQRDDNAWREHLEQAVARGAGTAAIDLARYYLDTFGNVLTARHYLEQAGEAAKNSDRAILVGMRLEDSLDFPAARARADRRLASLERPTVAARLERSQALLSAGDAAGARELLADFLAANPRSARTRLELHDLASVRGDVEEAEALLRDGAALHPFDVTWPLALASFHEGQDRLREALDDVGQALEIRPEDDELHRRVGELWLRLGERDKALAAFDEAFRLQPNLPELREYVEFLRATPSDFEDRVRVDLGAEIAEALRSAKEEGKAGDGADGADADPSRILLDFTAIQVNPDGTTKTFRQQAVQVLNDRGISSYDNFSTYYAEGEQVLEFTRAQVWHVDGTTSDGELSRYGFGRASADEIEEFGRYRRAAVDLPPMARGDVVTVEFVREDVRQSFFGDYFGHREIFQRDVPIARKVLLVEAPAEKELHFHERQLSATREETPGDGETVQYRWEVQDIERLEPEPAMAPWREVAPLVEISTFRDWKSFSEWYWNLVRKQYESSPEISSKVEELTRDAENDADRIRAIYNFIVTDIRYNAWEFGVHGFKPYNAATIFARRFGDCKDKATLMSVMLDEVGIDAHPVLIRGESRRGEEDLTLPLINHFNHCISYIPAADGREALFLDGTAQHHPYGTLPSMDRGASVLVVGKTGDSFLEQTPWNPPEEFVITESAVVTINPDLSGEADVRVRCRGDYAVFLRSRYEIEAQRRTDLERVFARRFAGASVTNESFSDLGNLDEPVHFQLGLEIPRLVMEAPEGLVLAMPDDFFESSRGLQALGALDAREFDVLLGTPRRSALEVTYRLPAGVRVKALPPERDLTRRFGRLKVSFRQVEPRTAEEPHQLVVERVLEITSPRVGASGYEAFREFAASLERLREEKIILERS